MPYDDIIVPELLPPSEDGVFRTLMCHPEAKPVLRDVVESYLRFPVVSVQLRNAELPISDIGEKRERFDVCCTADDGSQLDVEMQSEAMSGDSLGTNHRIIKSRAVYNLCDLHSGQAGRGVRYDLLMRSFQITFCGYTVFPERDGFVSRFSFRDENGVELSDAVGIIFAELTKLGDVMKKPVKAMTGEEVWACFLAFGSDPKHLDLIDRLCTAKGEIKMARDLLQSISQNEDERTRFRMRRKFQMDLDHNLIASRDEGFAEGLAEGEAKGLAEGEAKGRAEGALKRANAIARKMLEANMPVDTIAKITGLTREEVETLPNALETEV